MLDTARIARHGSNCYRMRRVGRRHIGHTDLASLRERAIIFEPQLKHHWLVAGVEHVSRCARNTRLGARSLRCCEHVSHASLRHRRSTHHAKWASIVTNCAHQMPRKSDLCQSHHPVHAGCLYPPLRRSTERRHSALARVVRWETPAVAHAMNLEWPHDRASVRPSRPDPRG